MYFSVINEFHPDYVSLPGDTLAETLETIGMSQAELASRMDRPVKTINEIIQAKAAITAETALQLEQVLHIPASFWLKREQHYRETLARLQKNKICIVMIRKRQALYIFSIIPQYQRLPRL